THRNKENRDNSPSKNDAKDALVIAESVSRGFYSEYEPLSPTYDRLKTLMSDREYWVSQQGSLGNRIVRWIDVYFPEFQQVFKAWDGTRALATLRAFPSPRALRKLTAEDVIKGWQEQGMKRAAGALGQAKAEQLLQCAAQSVGKRGTESEAQRDLKRLVELYDSITKALQEGMEEVEALFGDLPLVEQLRSIQGLGSVAIASLFSYAGDLRHYAHGDQLLRRAGLNLAERTSGRYKGQIKLSKRGDSALRKHLFLAVLSLVRQHPDFKRWHAHHVARGMTRMKSILKLVGKLCRILVGMVQRGEDYRRPGIAAAA
ncbi:transposase, partial [Paenibacillus sp. IB182496]